MNYSSSLQGGVDATGVKLMSPYGNPQYQLGGQMDAVVQANEPNSSVVLIDSTKRLPSSHSATNFEVKIGGAMMRVRSLRLRQTDLPLPPNITVFNNTLVWASNATSPPTIYTATLRPGYYNSSTIAAEIASKMSAATTGVDIMICVFNPLTKTFTISSSNYSWFFLDSSYGNTFERYGENFARFAVYPDLTGPSTPLTSHSSGVAGLIFTRYAIVYSKILNKFAYGESRTSDINISNSIIGIIPLSSSYTPFVFDTGEPFAGIFTSVTLLGPPKINIANSSMSLSDIIDIFITDEYNHTLHDLYNMDIGGPVTFGGTSLWFEAMY